MQMSKRTCQFIFTVLKPRFLSKLSRNMSLDKNQFHGFKFTIKIIRKWKKNPEISPCTRNNCCFMQNIKSIIWIVWKYNFKLSYLQHPKVFKNVIENSSRSIPIKLHWTWAVACDVYLWNSDIIFHVATIKWMVSLNKWNHI